MNAAKKTTEQPIPEEISALSFEAALAALEEIVRNLEAGEVDLEESINIYERGVFLKRHCEAKLKSAEARIEKIIVPEEGRAPTGSTQLDVD